MYIYTYQNLCNCDIYIIYISTIDKRKIPCLMQTNGNLSFRATGTPNTQPLLSVAAMCVIPLPSYREAGPRIKKKACCRCCGENRNRGLIHSWSNIFLTKQINYFLKNRWVQKKSCNIFPLEKNHNKKSN